MAEFRRLTVLFVNFIDLNCGDSDALVQMQQAISTMPNVLHRYEGTVHQFIVDDKGVVLIATFVPPPLAHEDNAARGILAALEIQTQLRQLELRSAIGITTGRVFCGPVGNDVRRTYVIIGNTINLAAQLMQSLLRSIGIEQDEIPDHRLAEDNGGVLCDATTA